MNSLPKTGLTDTAPPLAIGPIPIYFSHSNILVD